MDFKPCNSCGTCPVGWDNFKNLTEAQIKEIDETRFEARYRAGEMIFKQGTPTPNAVFMANGLAKLYLETEEGKRVIIALIKPGRLIGGPGIFIDDTHYFNLAAVEDSTVCFIGMNMLKKMVHENGDFAEGFLRDISIKGLESLRKIITFSQKKMNGRLAEGLLYLSDKIYNTEDFDCQLTRQEIGELTLMTKESVVRLLKEFDEEGILDVKGGRIKILDKERLNKIMQSG
ncbi:Crp/Fnr family transcriptional regulator [Salinivirga cyanobacteriivorans]